MYLKFIHSVMPLFWTWRSCKTSKLLCLPALSSFILPVLAATQPWLPPPIPLLNYMQSHGRPSLINYQSIRVWLIKEPIRFKQIKGHHQCQPLIKPNAEFHAYETLMHWAPLRVEILTPLVTPDLERVKVEGKFHIYGLTFGFRFYFFNSFPRTLEPAL